MWICSSVQWLSRVWLFVTPWTAACQASPSFTISWILLKLKSIESVMPFNHLLLCYPLLVSSIFPSIRVFSSESVLCIRWSNYWSFSFSTSPSNEYSGLISVRIYGLISLQSKRLSRVFSSTTVWKINSSALSLLYGPTLTTLCDCYRNHSFNFMDLYWQSDVSAFKYSI